MVETVFACAFYAWLARDDVQRGRFPFGTWLYRGTWPADPQMVRGFFGVVWLTILAIMLLMVHDRGLSSLSLSGLVDGPVAWFRLTVLPSVSYTLVWLAGWTTQVARARRTPPVSGASSRCYTDATDLSLCTPSLPTSCARPTSSSSASAATP